MKRRIGLSAVSERRDGRLRSAYCRRERRDGRPRSELKASDRVVSHNDMASPGSSRRASSSAFGRRRDDQPHRNQRPPVGPMASAASLDAAFRSFVTGADRLLSAPVSFVAVSWPYCAHAGQTGVPAVLSCPRRSTVTSGNHPFRMVRPAPDARPKCACNGGVTVPENPRGTALIRDDDELMCPLTHVGAAAYFRQHSAARGSRWRAVLHQGC
jgi:hypothetical protein